MRSTRRYCAQVRLFGVRQALSYRVPRLFGPYRPETEPVDIVISGFPRSANTYTVRSFLDLNPGITIAHHEHSIREMRYGIERALPVLVLVRSPLDAIASYLEFNPRGTVGQAIEYYARYYRAALQGREALVVSDFDTVTQRTNEAINAVNARFGTQLALFRTDEQRARVHTRMRTVAAQFDIPANQQAFPDASRASNRDTSLRTRVQRHRRFGAAGEIYAKVSEHSV